jgi:hypothetical protein
MLVDVTIQDNQESKTKNQNWKNHYLIIILATTTAGNHDSQV